MLRGLAPLTRTPTRRPPPLYRSTMTSQTLTTDQVINQLSHRSIPPPLEPGKKVYDSGLTSTIAKLPEHRYLVASLHLLNDDIEGCHSIAQADEGDPTADLLHATLHRREGDYWNSKYWWNRIRSHPTVPSISKAKTFVDQCEKAHRTGDSAEDERLRTEQYDQLKGLVGWIRENCKD